MQIFVSTQACFHEPHSSEKCPTHKTKQLLHSQQCHTRRYSRIILSFFLLSAEQFKLVKLLTCLQQLYLYNNTSVLMVQAFKCNVSRDLFAFIN